MAAVVPPFGDVSSGGWDKVGASSISEAVDDGSGAHDGDSTYAFVDDGSTCELSLAPLDHPNRTDGHVIRSVSKKVLDLGATCTLRVELFCGATLIATMEFDETGSYVKNEYTLTDVEAAAITDYSALSFKMTDVASPSASQHRVTALDIELPDRVLHCFSCG